LAVLQPVRPSEIVEAVSGDEVGGREVDGCEVGGDEVGQAQSGTFPARAPKAASWTGLRRPMAARRREARILVLGNVPGSSAAPSLLGFPDVEMVRLPPNGKEPEDGDAASDERLDQSDQIAALCAGSSIDRLLVLLSSAEQTGLVGLGPIVRSDQALGARRLRVFPRAAVMLAVTRPELTGPSGSAPSWSTMTSSSAFSTRCKRVMDVVVATFALAALLPLLLIIAVAIKVSSRGPVVFRQERIGRHGQRFAMLKFRSMASRDQSAVPASDSCRGPFPKLKRDPRVTLVGSIIRRSSLDELPQLWNVLRGDMSLIGPRPFVPPEAAMIRGWARARESVRPGMTGLWQVSGRNDLTFDDMCRLDFVYVTCHSCLLDLQIVLRTFRAVVRRAGAY
jgi:lipopolysaccharide/colanic/teichoic acid biosynthesis glycosyltransferase